MSYGRAFLAGLVGAAVLSLVMLVGRITGLPISYPLLLGTVFGGPPTAWRWVVGLAMHLVVGGLLAIGYAVIFTWWRRAGWLLGLSLSIPHMIVAGAVLRLLPLIHPLAPAVMPDPGAFLSNFGAAGVAAHVAGHLLFGTIVGAMYAPALADALRTRRALWPPATALPAPGRRLREARRRLRAG